MCKTRSHGKLRYGCGSYKRYGPSVCSPHTISHDQLSALVEQDLNQILRAVPDLESLAEEAAATCSQPPPAAQREPLQASLDRIYRRKKAAYEDYREGLLSKEDYLRYKTDYEQQQAHLTRQLEQLSDLSSPQPQAHPWVGSLLRQRALPELDRATIAETIRRIQVFEDGRVEIIYRFSDDLGLFPDPAPPSP